MHLFKIITQLILITFHKNNKLTQINETVDLYLQEVPKIFL